MQKSRTRPRRELRRIIIGTVVLVAFLLVAFLTAYFMYQHDERQVKTWERALAGDVEAGMDDVLLYGRMAVWEEGVKNALGALLVMALLTLIVGAYGIVMVPIITASVWFFLSREPALMPWEMIIPIGTGTLFGMLVNICEGYAKWPQRLFNWFAERSAGRSSCG